MNSTSIPLRRESPPTITLFLVVQIVIWGADYAALLVVIWRVDGAALLISSASSAGSFLQTSERFCKGTSVFWKGYARPPLALGEDCSSCRSLLFQVSVLPHWPSSLLCVFSWSSFLLCVSLEELLFGFGLWVYCKLCLEQTDSLLPGKELLLRLPDTIQPSHCLLPFSATCRRWSSIWAHLLQVGLLPVPALEKDSVTSCSERSALQPLDLAGLSGWRHWQ